MRKKLLDIQNKAVDNWDGRGAKQPNEIAMRRANLALDMLASMKVKPKDVIPSIESGIAIVFNDNNRYGEIEFFNEGDICLSLFDGTNEVDVCSVNPTKNGLSNSLHRINNFIKGEEQ